MYSYTTGFLTTLNWVYSTLSVQTMVLQSFLAKNMNFYKNSPQIFYIYKSYIQEFFITNIPLN